MIFRNNQAGFFNFNRNRINKSDRPAVRPEMGPLDWLLEALSLLGLMALLGVAIYHYPRLPESIPSHFNGSGMPDEYSARSAFLVLPGIALFIYTLLSFIVLIPHQFNYTVKITPANAMKQYAMAIRLIRYLKAAIIWLFFYISLTTTRVAAHEEPGLGAWFLPVVLGGIMIPVISYIILASRNR